MATTYKAADFNAEQAKSGYLCAVVNGKISEKEWNIEDAGIARYKTAGNTFEITVKGKSCVFTAAGNPTGNTPSGYLLKMATIEEDIQPAGIAAEGAIQKVVRKTDGEISVEEGSGDKYFAISSLNARDNFAVQILNGMLSRFGSDPTTLNKDTMSFYCRQAYDWASSMMTAAANARGEYIDDDAGDTTNPVEVDTLGDNTEKLLNNLVVAVERTNQKETIEHEGEDDEVVYYKRVAVNGWDELLDVLGSISTNLESINESLQAMLPEEPTE